MIKTGLIDKSHLAVLRKAVDVYSRQTVDMDSGFGDGVNNVDIDQEMTIPATKDLNYRMATRFLSMRYSVLRGAIKGQDMFNDALKI
ncbi:MAG: hypothetical protein ABFS42_00085 [Candidatus Krumholzibacteriota bacterium]